jgi:hypothetical protein
MWCLYLIGLRELPGASLAIGRGRFGGWDFRLIIAMCVDKIGIYII